MSADFTDGVLRKMADSNDDPIGRLGELPGRSSGRRPGFNIRICDIFGTPWRVPPGLQPMPLDSFHLTPTFREFYINQQGLPWLLAQLFNQGGSQLSVDGSSERFEVLISVEVVLFAFPIPVSQVVAALIVDLVEPTISNDDGGRVRRLRDAMVSNRIRLRGQSMSEIVDSMAERAEAKRVDDSAADIGAGAGSEFSLDGERHLLIFANPADPAGRSSPGEPMPADLDEQARALIYGVHWPYQPEFATITRPEDLNSDPPGDLFRPGRYAAVSHYASVLYGQSGEVDASALLIAAQTVGTAARFQSIWRNASRQVADFQRYKQAKIVGEKTRESLAPLAEEMGNLELDLTFNVQTAADLGQGSTTAFVDSFHHAQHEAMKTMMRPAAWWEGSSVHAGGGRTSLSVPASAWSWAVRPPRSRSDVLRAVGLRVPGAVHDELRDAYSHFGVRS